MNVYEASSMTRDSSRCGERRRRCPPGLTEERRAWVSQGGEEGRWLHCSWSWACWVHLAPWPDGKEAVPRDLITRGEMLRCELPNYESPGHTCSLEAHQCYRYWKIILAANFKLRRVPSGLQMQKKKSRLSLKKKSQNSSITATKPLWNHYFKPDLHASFAGVTMNAYEENLLKAQI